MTVEYDHNEEAFLLRHRRRVEAELRRLGPIHWSDAGDGYWVVVGAAAVRSALSDPATFSSAKTLAGGRWHGGALVPSNGSPPAAALDFDPPTCLEHRQHMAGMAVVDQPTSASRSFVAAVRRRLDDVDLSDHPDVVGDVLNPALAEWMQIEMGFAECGDRTLWSREHLSEVLAGAAPMLDGFGAALRSRVADATLSADLASNIASTLYSAGIDTTVALCAHSLLEFIRCCRQSGHRPEARDCVRAVLWSNTPTASIGRTVRTAVTFYGADLLPGQRVLLSLQSAHDDQGDDHARSVLSFGSGIHRCPGSSFAVHVAEGVVDAVADRFGAGQFTAAIEPYRRGPLAGFRRCELRQL